MNAELQQMITHELHYKGRQDDQVRRVLGPTTYGDYFMVVEQDYDTEADRTTFYLALSHRDAV